MKSKKDDNLIRIFLASSNELKHEREQFENFISRINTLWQWSDKPMLELNIWETASDTISFTRTQDEYNKIIKTVDIFVLIFWSKMGKYSCEEFDLANELFHKSNKPLIIVYQKNNPYPEQSVNQFLERFREPGKEYFHVKFDLYAELENSFRKELDIYISTNLFYIPDIGKKNRIELLHGLKRRYEKRLKKKMDTELKFKLDLKLSYTNHGTDENYIKKYYVNDYKIGKTDGFGQLFYQFEKRFKRLLILGEPGAGKTVMLLEFALLLIDKALSNFNYPTPIILNLATWRNEYKHFETWLEVNMVYAGGEYGTSKKYAAELMKGKNLLLLLDGLDEIPEDDRNSCLVELQKFIIKQENSQANSDFPQLIICSRINEYASMFIDAPVRASLKIESLNSESIKTALRSLIKDEQNSAAKILLGEIESDGKIVDQLDTAFKTHLALSLAHDFDFSDLSIKKLVDAYILKELSGLQFTEEVKAKQYLQFLSSKLSMVKQGITFELSDMQPSWLRYPFFYKLLVSFLLSLIVSVFLGFFIMQISSKHTTDNFLKISGLCFLIILITEFITFKKNNLIKFSEQRVFNPRGFFLGNYLKIIFKKIKMTSFISSIVSLLFLMVMSFFDRSIFLKTSLPIILLCTVIFSLFLGGITSFYIIQYSLLPILVSQFFNFKRFPVIKNPYQRLTASFIFNSVIIFCIAETLLFFLLMFHPEVILGNHFFAFLYFSLWILLYVVVNVFIISPLFKHFILRFILVCRGKIPLRYSSFLNEVSRSGIMEKEGGQWRFKHQIIQDRLK